MVPLQQGQAYSSSGLWVIPRDILLTSRRIPVRKPGQAGPGTLCLAAAQAEDTLREDWLPFSRAGAMPVRFKQAGSSGARCSET